MIEMVPSTLAHGVEIAMQLRDHDREEFYKFGLDPVLEIPKNIQTSVVAQTALVDGEVAMVWGLKQNSLLSGVNVWLITTRTIEKKSYQFLAKSRRAVMEALAEHSYLYCYVDAAYETSVRWLEWMGFEPSQIVDLADMKLIRYEMRAR